MKKIVYLLFFAILFTSCGIDSSKIIGEKFDSNSPPYGGDYGLYDKIAINGVQQNIYSVYYKNRVLTYIYKDGKIIDYYFSKFISYEKVVGLFPENTEYKDIVEKLGRPVSTHYASEVYGPLPDWQDDFIMAVYYQKEYDKSEKAYIISVYDVTFVFNLNWKLDQIQEVRSRFP
jgi:hypothetical protein